MPFPRPRLPTPDAVFPGALRNIDNARGTSARVLQGIRNQAASSDHPLQIRELIQIGVESPRCELCHHQAPPRYEKQGSTTRFAHTAHALHLLEFGKQQKKWWAPMHFPRRLHPYDVPHHQRYQQQ